MKFTPYTLPSPVLEWPYSPVRGNKSGFHIKYGKLGAWVYDKEGSAFCPAHQTSGTQRLEALVEQHWNGGRIMFLPCGYVAKPLQADADRGKRVIIG